jgi:hypothetical protein
MKKFVMTVVIASLLAGCSGMGMGGMGRTDSSGGTSGASGTSGTGDTSGSSSQRRSGSGTNPQSDEYGGPAR